MIESLALELEEALRFGGAALLVAIGLSIASFKRKLGTHFDTALLVELARLGRWIYPERTPGNLSQRFVILSYWLTHRDVLSAWYGRSDNLLLAAARARFPQIHGAIHWPYIHCGWSMEQRLDAIDRHYRLVEGRSAILVAVVWRDVEVARLDRWYPGLRLVLDRPSWFIREGEVVLNLFIEDRRIFSVAFTLGSEAGEVVAFVGAIQGIQSPDALQTYRDVTHALHGLRPRDLLLVALRDLLGAIGVSAIRGVSGEARHHHGRFFGDGEDTVLLDYDTIWAEHGGERRDDGFFVVPVAVTYRALEAVPVHKRAQYRRRYAMLDEIARDIEAACASHG